MNKFILPAKVQIEDRVSLEIGTGEHIFAFVKAIKFTAANVFYDLAVIINDENETTELRDVEGAHVSALVASVYAPREKSSQD